MKPGGKTKSEESEARETLGQTRDENRGETKRDTVLLPWPELRFQKLSVLATSHGA